MLRRTLFAGVAAACLLAAAAVPAAAQTIRVMTWNNTFAEGNEWWDKITSDFEALHPGVTVQGEFVAFAQYLTSLSAMTAGDSLPDIFWGNVKTLDLGKAGIALDYKSVVDQAFLDQFFPSTLRQFTSGDSIYALPGNAQMFGMFVNDRILGELGVDYPETWDQLIEIAPKVREAGLTPVAFGNLAKNICPDFFLPLIAQYGGDVYALDALDQDGVSWDSQPVVDALTLMQRLQQAGVFLDGINGVDERPAWQIAYQGRALMLYGNTSAPAIFDGEGTEDWLANYSARRVPAVTADGVHYSGDGSGRGFVTNAKGANKDLAVEFLKFFFAPENYNYIIQQTRDFPSVKASVPEITNAKVAEMATWLETDGANHILFGVGSWDAVSNVCQSILDGSIEPAAGAAQIQADVLAARAQQ
jgi:raffinose/stachyose/melibiose transport system substrate-binding protein